MSMATDVSEDAVFVGSAELQALFGVGRQRVQQLTGRPDFPAPVAELAAGRFWRREDVVAWAEARGRVVNEVPPTS